MQYSLSRLNPATLEALRDALGESESVDVFLSKLRKFLSGEGKSIAEQDLIYSTASELSAAGIFDLIPAKQLMSVIEEGEKSKAEAFKTGLAKRYRAALEELAPQVQVSQASNQRLRNPLVRVRSQGARKVAGTMTLQVPAQLADPSPPVGPALGQRGISIMEFCKAFNAKTQEIEAGAPIPTVVTYYVDKSFTMEIKTPPASYYLKKAAKQRRAGREGDSNSVTVKQVREIAEAKMKDLNVSDVDAAMQIILGSARSIGITVKK